MSRDGAFFFSTSPQLFFCMAAADARLAALFGDGARVALAPDPGDGRGRRVVATVDAAPGDTLFTGVAYVAATLSSHKKRVCAFCGHLARSRLTTVCGGCHAAFYCDDGCAAAAAAGDVPPAHAALPLNVPAPPPPLPHAELCGVLRALASFKGDAEQKSVLVMVATALAMREEGGGEATTHPLQLRHTDFESLVGHAASMTPRDAADWGKGCACLRRALLQAGWPPQRVPSVSALVDAAARVCANNFGCWRHAGRGALVPDETGGDGEDELSSALAAATLADGEEPAAPGTPSTTPSSLSAPQGDLVGRELYITISMLNHS